MSSLLIETSLFKPTTTLTEGVRGKSGNPIVEGILATADTKNGNGRYYPEKIWRREIDKYMDSVKNRRATGELDHPESTVINLKNVSHLITEIWWDGKKVMGKIEILPTPSGNILKSLIENNVTIGVSSRGMGSVQQMGETLEVQDDFELLCWDFVSTPSNPGSWMHLSTPNGRVAMNESVNKVIGKDYSKANEIIRELLCSFGQCPII